jgi:hypothetical protein
LELDTEKATEALAGRPLVGSAAAKLQRIAKDDFLAQFALSLALKHVRLGLQAAGDDLRRPCVWLTNGSRWSIKGSATRTSPS